GEEDEAGEEADRDAQAHPVEPSAGEDRADHGERHDPDEDSLRDRDALRALLVDDLGDHTDLLEPARLLLPGGVGGLGCLGFHGLLRHASRTWGTDERT